MDLHDVLAELNVDAELYDLIAVNWEDSQSTLPKSLPFLDPAVIREYREYAELDPALEPILLDVAHTIDQSPALRAYCWHFQQCLFQYLETPGLDKWPERLDALGDHSGVLRLLTALTMIPLVIEKHADLGIPTDITRNTCRQIHGFNLNHEVGRDGKPGLLPNQMFWLRNHVRGELFRIGRFEFRLTKLPQAIRLFRRRHTGSHLLLAPPGMFYDSDGYVVNPESNRVAWQSAFKGTDQHWSGTAVSPYGMARLQETVLAKTEWELILHPGDTVIDMHIPPGRGMGLDVCRRSFAAAVEFFAKHFPQRPAKAFYCTSWIYNTQFEHALPESNLAGLMREVYLFPTSSNGKDGIFFIFCREYDDWSKAPRDTSLQRAMLDIYTSGRRLRSGGMVFLIEHLEHFGTQYYRNHSAMQ